MQLLFIPDNVVDLRNLIGGKLISYLLTGIPFVLVYYLVIYYY